MGNYCGFINVKSFGVAALTPGDYNRNGLTGKGKFSPHQLKKNKKNTEIIEFC